MANARTAKQNEEASKKIVASAKPIIAKDIDPNQYITVRNGFQGKLIYVSKRTGETFEWDGFGEEQEMELRELRTAKNSYNKAFYINNWFMFNDEDDWVIDYLGVRQYYKNVINIDDFDDIFNMPPEELKKRVGLLSDGQKKSVEYRAKVLISEQKIDSLKVISALEEALGVELVESKEATRECLL